MDEAQRSDSRVLTVSWVLCTHLTFVPICICGSYSIVESAPTISAFIIFHVFTYSLFRIIIFSGQCVFFYERVCKLLLIMWVCLCVWTHNWGYQTSKVTVLGSVYLTSFRNLKRAINSKPKKKKDKTVLTQVIFFISFNIQLVRLVKVLN